MDIKLFDNRILAPSKCGTRHLRKIFTDVRFDINVHNINNISHIIIRNPYEHFESAIHTEYLNYTSSPRYLDHIIYGAISKNGIGHWHPNTYQFLYSIFLKNTNIQTIELSNLSTFLESMGIVQSYKKTDYDWSSFPNWKPKDILVSELKSKFKNEFNLIEEKLKIESDFYMKLTNKIINSRII